MPPITLHMVLAQRIADALGIPALTDHPGPLLIGSTSPDIRVITRWPREQTHFFALDNFDHQDSVQAFLDQHAHLDAPEKLSPETASFVAGYTSHLVMDEQYITGVYRNVFLDNDQLGGTVRANVMDRLLQFELDRQYGNEPLVKRRLIEALSAAVAGVEAGFIDTETLDRWRQVCLDVARRRMDWERARGMIENHLRRSGLDRTDELGMFLDQLPELRRETRAHISDAEVAGFIGRATDAAARVIERYFGCA
jgi:hypothetical protein